MKKIKMCNDCGDDLNFPKESKRNICYTCNCIRTMSWQKNNKEKVAKKARRCSLKKYGLTEESYDTILISQGGTCKICKGLNKNAKKINC